MHEFNNRVDAQRAILSHVNSIKWKTEKLFGLSKRSINRWAMKNGLDAEDQLLVLVVEASSSLFFLANRSQEQVDATYKMRVQHVAELTDSIRLLAIGIQRRLDEMS
jgi:hypothetical protein